MKRPRGVTIIGVLMFIQGLIAALLVGVLVAPTLAVGVGALPPILLPVSALETLPGPLAVGAQAVLGVLSLVGGIAILQLRPWAWFVAMLLQGIALVANLVSYFEGRPPYLSLLLAVVIVFYLNARAIRQVFDLVQLHTDSTSLGAAPASPLPAATEPIHGAAPERTASAVKESR